MEINNLRQRELTISSSKPANGCDSMVTLELAVLPVIAEQVTASICQGSSYLFGNQQLTTAGTYQQQLQTASGCDSTVTLELAVLPVIAEQFTASICQGSSYLFGNQQLTTAGTYQQQLQTASGCDSTVALELAVLPVIAEQITASICQGSSYLFGNQQLTAAGTYQQQLQTASGCDSTVTLELAVLPVTNSDAFVEICEGDLYNGSFYQQNTVLVDTFQAVSTGCDSIVHIHLTVWPKANVSLQDFRCWGDTFEGIRVFSDTMVLMVGQTMHGCDSFTVCTIDVNPVLLPQITAPAAICKGETAVLQGSNSSSYLWSTGEHASSISVQQPGEYQLTITDAQGCTATAQHQLAVSAMEADLEMQPPLCVGDENGVIGFEVAGGFPPYLASLDGQEFQETERFTNLPTGNYQLYFRDQLACNLKHEVHLPDPPVFEVKALEDATLKLGETMDLSAVGTLPIVEYIWWPIVGLDCANCPSPTAMPLATSDYWIFAKNENGCEAEASVRLVVTKDEDVYVPNVFSPNGDGINDFFTLYPGRSVLTIKRLLVFDRWGEPVFECYDAPPFHPLSHWHGKFKDMPAQSSVYVWMAEIEYIDGTTRLLKGDVSLMR